jgi:phosphatidylinositol glycan class B
LWEYPTRKYTWLLPALGLFLWFIPFVACRFSSETWSALFFFAGVLPFVGRKNKPKPLTLIVSGFALGLSFHFRYQAIILIAGLFLWLLLMNKAQLKNVLLLTAGLIPALFAGILADKWLYNEWAFPFINYLDFNIFSGQANETFGTSPWWYYFGRFAEKSAIVPGSIVLLSLFYFLFKNPRHLFNWLWLPFLVAHMFTGHKELRFLIPVFPVIPFVLFYMFQETRQYFTLKRFVLNPLITLALTLNFFMLIILAYSPAEFSVKALEEIQKNPAKSNTVYYSGENPASPFGLPNNFYTNKTMTFEKVDSLPATASGSKYIYITYKGALPEEFATTKPVLQSIPSILRFFNFNGWLDRTTRSELRILD